MEFPYVKGWIPFKGLQNTIKEKNQFTGKMKVVKNPDEQESEKVEIPQNWKDLPFKLEDNPHKRLFAESLFKVLYPNALDGYLKEVFHVVQKALQEHYIKAEINRLDGELIVKTTPKTFDPVMILKAHSVIRVLARYVPLDEALTLLEDDNYEDIISIDHRKKDKFLKRKNRIDDKDIKALITEVTSCKIFISGKSVAVIGPYEGLNRVRKLVTECFLDNIHPIYHLERFKIMNKLAEMPEISKEDWKNYLPPIPKKKNKLQKLLDELCDPSKLKRDKAEEILYQINIESDCQVLIQWISNKFESDASFENCFGSLMGSKIFLTRCNNIPIEFLNNVSKHCLSCHNHNDYRVRILAGDCMGLLCQILGLNQFKIYIAEVIQNINLNLANQNENQIAKSSNVNAECKSLETWIKCFQAVINGIGDQFQDVVELEMIYVIFETLSHKDRYIREAGYELLGTIAEKHGCVNNKEVHLNTCKHLRKGLTDNWSQVRMAASIASRKLLILDKALGVDISDIYSILLPGICMNRHYLAEGVKLYNQETWKMVVGDSGRELIERYIDETVSFYVEQTESSNHAVREAACASISEMAMKFNKDVVRPYLEKLLDFVVVCCDDYNSSVRDMAYLATGRLIASFPNKTQEYRQDVFVPLFFRFVVDSVSYARESAAYSLANIVGAYDSKETSYLKDTIDFIFENLENIQNQTDNSGNPRSNSDYPERENFFYEDSDHLNQDAHLSGHHHDDEPETVATRCSELWEKADGCILLIGALSNHAKDSHNHMDGLIAAFTKACYYRQYPEYVLLLATACKVIANLYEGLGKTLFKKYFTEFLGIIESSVFCGCKCTSVAVGDTIRFLSTKIGANILKGRIELHSTQLLERVAHLFDV